MTASKQRFLFLPLGGSGEIGMNMNLFGYGAKNKEKWIMVDCGVTFTEPTTPGIDLIYPQFDFIKERKKDLQAIILTHAHEDHIGAIAYVWPQLQVPMYATPFTVRMIQDKFKDRGIDYEGFLHTIPLKTRMRIGDFGIEFVSITHSIPEPNGLYITTPEHKIYHTGDWKFDDHPVLGDATDYHRLAEIADMGLDACICDSTNALDAGVSGSEYDILKPMTELVREATGKVVITSFASNVARMKTLIQACVDADRKYFLAGRSMERIYNHGREMGYFAGIPDPVPFELVRDIPNNQIACICTGSQGESRATLAKIARDAFPFFSVNTGDTVIFSSKAIPGNEKSIGLIYNQLSFKNVKIVTSKSLGIHVSGHPCQEELIELYQALKPYSVIPVHGERRHMVVHAELALKNGAKQAIIPQNGDMIEITKKGSFLVQEVSSGRIYIDGKIQEESFQSSSSARNRLGFAGCTTIFLPLSSQGKLVHDPIIQNYGVPSFDHLFQQGEKTIVTDIKQTIGELSEELLQNDEKIIAAVKQTYRRMIQFAWGKKPITEVKIARIQTGKKR